MFKEKIKDWGHKAFNWCYENRETLAVVIPLGVAGVTATSKLVNKSINHHQIAVLKDKRCYDRSLGHYWELNRKLSNSEWLAVENRVKNGEQMGSVLSSMNVLK